MKINSNMEIMHDSEAFDSVLFWGEESETKDEYDFRNHRTNGGNGGNVITNYFGNIHGTHDFQRRRPSNKIFIIPCESFDGITIYLEIKRSDEPIKCHYSDINRRFSHFKFYFNLGDGTKCNLEINGADWIKDDYDPYMWTVIGTFAYMNFGMEWCWKSVDTAHDYIKGMLLVWNKYSEKFYKKMEPLVDDYCGDTTDYINSFLGDFHYIEDNEKLIKKYEDLVKYYVKKYPDNIPFTKKDKLIELMQLYPHMFMTNRECIVKN